MTDTFDRIAVIGAGTMGTQLAALFAGAGCEVLLVRATAAADEGEALSRVRRVRPPALYVSSDAKNIRVISLDHGAAEIAGCDWVVESVVEDAEAKAAVFRRVEGLIGPQAILTSNTSAIPCSALAKRLRPDVAGRFFVAHFFNPPRRLKLVELCPHSGSDGAAARRIERFLAERLGKGVVRVKDTPGFIANRIGVHSVMVALHLAYERGWPIEAVDAVLGRPAARPRQGVFRMLDMVGLDTLAAVARNLQGGCAGDDLAGPFQVPDFLDGMLANGWTGLKAGRGFYSKDESGSVCAIDPRELSYRPRASFRPASLAGIDAEPDAAARLRRTVFAEDEAGEIAWPAVSSSLVYAASCAGEIADDIGSIDRALRWGYNWELGPFEAWDALGVRRVAERIEREGGVLPAVVRSLLESGRDSFYDGCGPGAPSMAGARSRCGIVDRNASASLLDLGDGIFACEFHTKMNALDQGTIRMLERSLDRIEREGIGLVIANDGEAFCVGADLALIGGLAERGDFDELDRLVAEFQRVCQRIRFSPRPVVAAPFGRALGGGCEIALAACRRIAHIESYMGLVEMSVGLIPAGGGCKDMLLAMEASAAGGPHPKSRAAFELIATARVSTSAREAVELGYLTGRDPIVMDRDALTGRAGEEIAGLAGSYVPPPYRDDIALAGRGGELALVEMARAYRARGLATDYDLVIAEKLARVLSGGDWPALHAADEQRVLDLAREAFLSLAGEPKTQARIAHMLKTKRPLRN